MDTAARKYPQSSSDRFGLHSSNKCKNYRSRSKCALPGRVRDGNLDTRNHTDFESVRDSRLAKCASETCKFLKQAADLRLAQVQKLRAGYRRDALDGIQNRLRHVSVQ